MLIEGEPWFVAADVLRSLGVSVAKGTYTALLALDGDEKRITPQTLRGKGGTAPTVINESGLYKLILRAQRTRPEAAAFQDWVTREVLPAIRKTGGYLLNEEARATAAVDRRDAMPLPQDFPAALRALADEVGKHPAARPIGTEMATARGQEETAIFCGFQVAGRTTAN